MHRVVALPPFEAGTLWRLLTLFPHAPCTPRPPRPQEMLRTLQEQVQQRDAVIANLRRQLAVVTAAAVAQGVQLQQLPGLGPQAGQGPHIGRGGAG